MCTKARLSHEIQCETVRRLMKRPKQKAEISLTYLVFLEGKYANMEDLLIAT